MIYNVAFIEVSVDPLCVFIIICYNCIILCFENCMNNVDFFSLSLPSSLSLSQWSGQIRSDQIILYLLACSLAYLLTCLKHSHSTLPLPSPSLSLFLTLIPSHPYPTLPFSILPHSYPSLLYHLTLTLSYSRDLILILISAQCRQIDYCTCSNVTCKVTL